MNYGVKYDILVNEKAAVAAINNFQMAVEKATPKIVGDLKKINTAISKTMGKLNNLSTAANSLNKINLSRARNEISQTQAALRNLKSKSVTVTTRYVNADSTASASQSTSGGKVGSRSSNQRLFTPIGGVNGKKLLPTSFLAGLSVPLITMGATALFGRFIRDMIMESAQFEDTMTSVRNILRTTDKDAATFEKRFRSVADNMQQIGVDTKFTSLEIAGGAKYLAMAGMDLATINASMRPIANLAALSDTPIDKVADVVTNIMAGYGIGAKDIGATSDIIASMATSTNTSVMEMAESFKFASRPLQMAGIDFREGAAAIGILANAGVKGTLAGTAIRAMMIRLTDPTAEARKALDRLGITITETVDGVEKMKTLSKLFGELRKAGATVQDMYMIFDKIAGGASTAVYQSLLQLDKLTSKAASSGGIAQFLAEEKMKTVVGLWDQITSQIKYLNQAVFDSIEPEIKMYQTQFLDWLKSKDARDVFMEVGSFIKQAIGFAKWFFELIYDNFDKIKAYFVGRFIYNRVIGLSNAVFGLIGTFKTLSLSLSTTATAGAGAGAAMSGIGVASSVAVGAVAAVVSAIGLLAINTWQVKSEANNLFESLNNKDARFLTLEKLQKNLNGVKDAAKDVKTELENKVFKLLEASPYKDTPFLEAMITRAVTGTASFFGAKVGFTADKINALKTDIIPKEIAPTIAESSIGELWGKYLSSKDFVEASGYLNSIRQIGIDFSKRGSRSIQEARKNKNIDLSSEKFLMETKEVNTGISDYIFNVVNSSGDIMQKWLSETPYNILSAMNQSGAISSQSMSAFKFPDLSDFDPAKIRAIYQSLTSFGFTEESVVSRFKRLGIDKYLHAEVTPDVEFRPEVTTKGLDTGIDGLSLTPSGSGSGGIRGGGSKNIIVNIQNLMNIESANLEGDMSSMKDKIAQVLLDAVKDFELAIG